MSLLLLLSQCLRPISIDFLKVNIVHRALHRDVMKKSLCHRFVSYITLSIYIFFLSPGSFSVKRTAQLTAVVGALCVRGRTEAVGEKDESLSQNVKMAADLEASGLVLHPFQCPRKYSFTPNKFSPCGFFPPLLPQSVSWKI